MRRLSLFVLSVLLAAALSIHHAPPLRASANSCGESIPVPPPNPNAFPPITFHFSEIEHEHLIITAADSVGVSELSKIVQRTTMKLANTDGAFVIVNMENTGMIDPVLAALAPGGYQMVDINIGNFTQGK